MKQDMFLIYSKTDLRAVHQYNSPNIIEGYKNFQIFVENQVKQNSQFMPVRFSDYVLLRIGTIDPDFVTNNNQPLVAFDKYDVITKTTVERFIEALQKDSNASFDNLGSVVYDFEKEMNKKIEEANK